MSKYDSWTCPVCNTTIGGPNIEAEKVRHNALHHDLVAGCLECLRLLVDARSNNVCAGCGKERELTHCSHCFEWTRR